MKLFFFKCSVSQDLYGVSPHRSGKPLPTPGGGTWLPIEIIDSDHLESVTGLEPETAYSEIDKWGCHWFTTKGPTDIYWGEEGPPKPTKA